MRRSFVLLVVLFAALLAGEPAAAALAAPPLIGDWPLELSESVGPSDVTPDSSGNGLALSSPGGTMHFGTELGKFGGYLSSANTTPLQYETARLAPAQMTLLAWIRQSGNPGTLRYIAGRGNDGPTCGGSSYALYTGYPGQAGLHFYVRQSGPEAVPVLTEAPPDSAVFDGNWHLVAGTFDGVNIRLYVDGHQVGAPQPANGISYGPPITDGNFYVDGYPPQSACSGISDFPGSIDEVRVYQRALSASELGRLAAAPGPVPPVLEPDPEALEPVGPPAPPGSGPPAPGQRLAVSLGGRGGTISKPDRYTVLPIDVGGPAKETKVSIDGNPGFNLDPDATAIGLNLGRPGEHTITATTIGTGGEKVTSSTQVTVPDSGAIKKGRGLPDSAVSTSSNDITALISNVKNYECVPDSTVVFGIAEAHGCFRMIDPSPTEFPAPERAVAEEYFADNFIHEHAPRPCQSKEPGRICKPPTVALQPFVASGNVQLNGMTIEPLGAASVIVFPALSRVISSNARLTYDGVLGKIPVRSGALNLDLQSGVRSFTSGDAELPVFSFDTSKAFEDIGGFPINGTVGVVLQRRGDIYSTALKVNLSLPPEITTAAGADPTAAVEVDATNERGTYLDHLNIHIDEAFLGPVEIANVDFTYNEGGDRAQGCPAKWWTEVFFIPVETGQQNAGLRMAPEPQRNGIAFCAGKLHSAGAELVFGYPALPPPEIFPGVTLNAIGFSFQLNPPIVFDGHAVIRSGEVIEATGGFLAAFASPAHPYTFTSGDAGGALVGLRGHTFTSTTVAVGGDVKVRPAEGVAMDLGNAYMLYSYPDYIAAAGEAHLQTYLFAIDAGGGFELSTATHKFNGYVKGHICLLGGITFEDIGACAGGEGHISSRGISACLDVGSGTWTPGVGMLWGELVPRVFAGALGDGCKPSEFWEANVRARVALARRTATGAAASPAGSLSFRVQPGEGAKTVELTGAGGSPMVTVTAPDGEKITSAPNLGHHGPHLSTISGEKWDRTWIGVSDAEPGLYKVALAPDSPAIVDERETRAEPEAGVTATVTGSGRHLVLSYDAGHAKGQTVSFYERGKGTWDLLKRVKGGKGKVRFEPSLGAGGPRTVAAQVEVGGLPAPLETLDHFKAPPPPAAGQVGGVRAIHRGDRVKPRRLGLTVRHVSPSEAGRVEVLAFGALGDRGKPARAKFDALRKAKTRLLPYSELGEGKDGGTPHQHAKKHPGAKSA
jgi:hypothetical protein